MIEFIMGIVILYLHQFGRVLQWPPMLGNLEVKMGLTHKTAHYIPLSRKSGFKADSGRNGLIPEKGLGK
jgi:hypothetical protein